MAKRTSFVPKKCQDLSAFLKKKNTNEIHASTVELVHHGGKFCRERELKTRRGVKEGICQQFQSSRKQFRHTITNLTSATF